MRDPRVRGLLGYAPHAILTDPGALGLVESRVTADIGTTLARHRPERTSTRATVFLHGAAGTWTTWTPLLQSAAALGVAIENPVLIDLPGWGAAGVPASTGPLTVEAYATFVKDTAEALGYTEWDLVGHSLGGSIAMHMAAAWPERVLSVGVVSATAHTVIRSIDHPLRHAFEMPAFSMLWRVMQAFSPLGARVTPLLRALERVGVLRLAMAPLFRHPFRVPRSLGEALAREMRPASFVAAVDATRGYDADAEWAGIQCPVRAVKGDADVFVTDADFAALSALLPGNVLVVVPGCGHFGHVERPAEVLVALGFADGVL